MEAWGGPFQFLPVVTHTGGHRPLPSLPRLSQDGVQT